MQLNENIIKQFKLLLKYLQYLYNHSNDKQKNKYRIISIKRGLDIIKEHPYIIKSSKDLNEYYGIGEGIKKRIDEIIKTGKLSELNEIDKVLNNEEKKNILEEDILIKELSNVIGIGRSYALKLINKYNIKSVDDLKNRNNIDLNNNIKLGLKYYNKYKKDIPREEITEINNYLNKVSNRLNKNLILTICGSYRRNKIRSNDIDVLLTMKKDSYPNMLGKFIKELREDNFIIDSLTDENVNTKYMGFCKWKKIQ